MATFPGFGRTFDFAMRACEKSQPLLLPILRDSHLFCFPHDPEEIIGAGVARTTDEQDFWMENFALPYSVTAIEDRLGMSLIWDADCLDDLADDGSNIVAAVRGNEALPVTAAHPLYVSTYPRRGLNCWRFFASVRGSWSYTDKQRKMSMPDGNPVWMVNPDADHVYIAFGAVKLVSHEGRTTSEGSDGFSSRMIPLGVWCLSKSAQWFGSSGEKGWSQEEAEEHQRIINECAPEIAHEAHGAMEEIMWFSNPDRFVVEETREKESGRSKKWGKSKRSKERPTYHSCTALDIRRLRGSSGESSGDGTKKRGHHRRGHFRTLRADRYAQSGMQGKTILVRPCFVGDETFTVKRHHYRVLLGENEVLVGEQQKAEQNRAG